MWGAVGFLDWLQHYMMNSSINEKLAAAAQVGDGNLVLEIGPGTGSLTNVLINAGATVVAVEKVGFKFFDLISSLVC